MFKLNNMKSHRPYLFFIFTILYSIPCITANAQSKEFTLIRGVKTSSTLTTGDIHRYTMNLDSQQFIYVNLFQNGIDLNIVAYSPDGTIIGQFDSPNYRNGDEPITLLTDKEGKYVLEVSSIDTKNWKGQYDITLLTVEPKGTTPEKQIEQIMARFSSNSAPGASIAVVMDGKVVFRKGYGNAELEYDNPITPFTVFHIASVSKQFTAFAILMLESEGRLSIRDDIRKYIPEVPDFGKTITLDHLLHHTSGLRDQWELLALAGWRLDDIITTKQILNLVSHQKELNFNPGDQMMYCNTGFTLLAEVVARVSGMSFAEFTRTRIFEPLKMSQTQFYDDCQKVVKNRAYSYFQESSGYKKSNLNYSTVGATSLFTTSEDLCNWALNFENPVVGKDFIEKMAQKGVLNNGDTIGYAMGQGIYDFKGLKVFEHGGADAGYRSDLMRIPGRRFSVNVLSNLASFNPGDIAAKIRDMYLPDLMTNDPTKPEEPVQKEEAGNIELTPDHLRRYAGRYELQPGMIATITAENRELFAEAPGLPNAKMIPLSETTFTIKEAGAEVTFLPDANGSITKIKVSMQGQVITANRLPDFDPASVNLKELTGLYFSDELNTGYTFVIEGEKLIARHFRTGDVKLTPLKENVFTGDQWYFAQIEFLRDQSGSVSGCLVSSNRIKHVKFNRMKTSE